MLKKYLFFVFVFYQLIVFGQGSEINCGLGVSAGSDIDLDCGNCTDLTATINTDNLSISLNTNTYVISQEYCVPIPVPATATNITVDDEWSQIVNIGFDFEFFGNTYNQLLIGDNGVVTFDIVGNTPGGFCEWFFVDNIPSTNLFSNTIFGAYHDLLTEVALGGSGSIEYFLTGTAPFRQFVINFNNVAHYIPGFAGCDNIFTTQQVIIQETTNIVTVNIANKPSSCTWNGGRALVGIQNASGTFGYAAPGRQTSDSPWGATNETWQFIPENQLAPDFTFFWTDASNNVISTNTTVNVCPPNDTTYTANLICNNCDTSPVTLTDDVNVTVGIIPVMNDPADEVVCEGDSVSVNFTSSIPATTYSWVNDNTNIGLAASGTGNISFTATNTTSSPITATITVTPDANNCGNGIPETFTITVWPVLPAPVADSPQQFCTADSSTLADVQVQGSLITFYDMSSGGNILPSTTLLTDGMQVWAAQGICGLRTQIDIQVDTIVDAPVVDSPLQFCTADSSTLADVASQTTGINLIFWDAATGGNQLPQSTLLTDGLTIWISQGVGSCAVRAQVDIQVDDVVDAPLVDSPLQFCTTDNSTLADVASQTTGVNLIFWDAATGGNQLPQSTLLTDGLSIWISQGIGSCAVRAQVTIQVDDVVDAPVVDSPLQFCTADNSTLADVASQTTGINLIFWDAATGGNQLPQSTLLTDGLTIWISQGVGSCAVRAQVDIQVDDVVDAPTLDSPLQFCTADNSTLADVASQTTGINLIFWDAATGGNQLPQSTLLTDGLTIWISQGIGSCAVRAQVDIQVDAIVDAPVVDSPLQFCTADNSTLADVASQTTGINLIFWDAAIGGNQLPQSTLLTDGLSVWISQGVGSCAVRAQVDIQVDAIVDAPIVDSPLQFCTADNSTLADVASQTTGINLIFWDAAIGGNQLPQSTLLTDGLTIWISQGTGSCAVRTQVDIQVDDVVDAPIVDSPLQFCIVDNSTLADVASQTTGINLIFWDVATGGNQLPQSILLTDGLTIWVSQGIGSCAIRAQVDIQVDDVVDAPVVDSPLQFCTADNSTLADVASQTTGINLIFWDAATGGNQLSQSTLLTDGLTVWISQGVGSCATRAQVDIQVDDVVDAPVVDSPLQFCTADNSTLADVASQTTGINLIFWDAVTGGNQLPQSTLLTDGLTIWIGQGTGSCAVRAQVDIQVDTIVDAPVVDSPLQFCTADNSTLADVASQTTGINLIFWDVATGGNQVSQSTLLTDGLTIWVSQGIGSCAVRAQVDIQVDDIVDAPLVDSPLQFCTADNSTLADVASQATGINLIFWDAATGGNQLPQSTLLTDGLTIWISQGTGSCAVRAQVDIQVDDIVDAPLVDSPLQFCTADNSTLADVASQATGINLIFWDAATGGNQLPQSTLLTDGLTIWVSQGVGSCAVRAQVDIQVDDVVDAPIVDSPLQFCTADSSTLADVANQTTGINLIFWDAATGGNQLPQSILLTDGLTIWVSQGTGSCAIRAQVDIQVDDVVDAPVVDSPLQFCTADNSTLADVASQTTGINLIFWDAATGGNQLSQSTLLTDGLSIWISQGTGSCAVRVQVDIQVDDVVDAPLVDSPLQFCTADNSTLADVASQTTGINLIFWDAATGGNQLPQSTLLTDGLSVWISQGIGSCAVRAQVDIQVDDMVDAPVVDSPLQFCIADNSTLADVASQTTGINLIFWDAVISGNQVSQSTLLTDGLSVWISQGTGSCAVRAQVDIQVDAIVGAPIVDSPLQFCTADNSTLADVASQTTGINLIFWDAATGGNQLPQTTTLTDGLTIWISQGVGSCAIRAQVDIQVDDVVDASVVDSPLQFCTADNSILADVASQTTGINLIFWDAAIGGNQLSQSTLLTDGLTIWVSQGIGSCAVRAQVDIQVDDVVDAPIVDSPLQFCTADNSTLAGVASQTTGINLIFWDASTGGNQLPQSTLLTDGLSVWISQGTGSCAVRAQVDIQVDDVVDAPIVDSPLQFCTADNSTLADVASQTTGINLIFWDAATGGNQLPQTTLLTDGLTIWISQGTGSCAVRVQVDIQVDDVVDAPVVDSPLQFCTADNSTLADVASQTTGINLIFWDAATGGNQLPQSTLLSDGLTIWISQGIGSCAVRAQVDIQVDDVVDAPMVDSPLQFCTADSSTLADVASQTTGINLIFWDAAIGGNQLSQSTLLTDGLTIWISQGTGSCAVRTQVDIQVDAIVDAPLVDSPLQFCTADNSTLADVANQTTGVNLIFWDAATGGNQLPQSTLLTDGLSVWISQGIGSCAVRAQVDIQVDDVVDAPMVDSPLQFCTADSSTLADVASQTTGINLIFWDASTGGNQLPQSTLLTDGLTIWISQGIGSCAVRAQVDTQVDDVVDAPAVDSPLQFCTADNGTLADVASQTTGINLIFWDATTGGNQLPQSTLLTDGLTVWISQGTGSCAARAQVDIQVDAIVDAPVVDSPLQFCTADNSTLADVANQTTGINLIFWDAATGGNQLPQSTLLTDGLTIWISQGTGSCAARAQVDIQVDDVVDAPTVDSPLQFCTADSSTLADVVSQTTGINLIFWDAAAGGNQVPQSTLLTDGLTIWISQGTGSCAVRAQVDIQVDDVVDSPVVDSPLQFCTADNSTLADVASQTTGINLIFWDAAAGGNQVPQSTLLTDGLTIWISQGTGSCAVRAQVDIQVDDVVDSPVVDSPLQFCTADNSTLADVASQTTGINLIFWDATTGGNQLPQSTLLTDGLSVWVSQGTGSCAVRAQVDIQVDDVVDAPIVDSPLQFCTADNSTLADVASQTTGINLIFWDAATGGNQLPQSTLLTDGLTIWISQGTGSCAVRAQVDIQVDDVVDAPVVDSPLQFCTADSSTLADVASQTTGINLIFWDAATGGNQLPQSTLLTDGLTIWISQGTGSCAVRAQVDIQVDDVVDAPTVDSPLQFCTADNSTLADVASQTTGINLIFWDAATGGNQLSQSTLLTDGLTIWISQGTGSCAVRAQVDIQVDDVVDAPTVDSPLQFCTADNSTLADVASQTTGINLIFWDAATGGNQLPQSTLLTDGLSVWISQGIGSCAVRAQVDIQVDDVVDAPMVDSPLQFCTADSSTLADVASQTTGINLIFWDAATGGNQLPQSTLLTDGLAIWISQGTGSCAVRVQVDIQVDDVVDAPTVDSPLQFCTADNSTLADVASQTTGINLIFWDAATGGNQLPQSTLLTDGLTVWISQGVGSCAVRAQVEIQVDNVVDAPVVDSPLQFCTADNSTLADVASQTTGINLIFWDAATGGNQVPQSTLLTDGLSVWISQGVGSCAVRAQVDIQVDDVVDAPIVDSPLQFCTADNSTLADVASQTTGINLIFWDAATGGNQVPQSTLLTDGLSVWISQGTGSCAVRAQVDIQVDDVVDAPVVDSPLQFCTADNSTLANVVSQTIGNNLTFWDAATAGNQLPETTILLDNMIVWISQGSSSCAVRAQVDIQVDDVVDAPTVDSPLQFCTADNSTLADVASQTTGINLIFWDAATGGNQLPQSSLLTDGLSIWISQGTGSCAVRAQVDIQVDAIVDAPVVDSPLHFCTADSSTLADVASQTTGINLIFWDAATGGNQLPQSTLLMDDLTIWVSQGIGSCAVRAQVDIQVDDVVDTPVVDSPLQFCTADNSTLADVASQTTGINLIFWDAATGGNQLSQSTLLTDGLSIWVSQGTGNCAVRTQIDIQVDDVVDTPVVDSPLQFCTADNSTLADVTSQTTGINLIFWDAATGGNQLPQSTLLSDGLTIWVSQGIESCAVRTQVDIQVDDVVDAPVVDSPLQFCTADSSTLADVAIQTTGINLIFWDAATDGNQLPQSTLLTDGLTIWVSQGIGSCAVRAQVDIQVDDVVDAPTVDSPLQFCTADSSTLADVASQTTGINLIFWDAAAGGNQVPQSTLLTDGLTIWISQGVGSCAVRAQVDIQVDDVVDSPVVDSPLQFCTADNSTLADVASQTTGINLIFWDAATGGNQLPQSTLLTDGLAIWISQGTGSCAVRVQVDIQVDDVVDAPTVDSPLQFCTADSLTLADVASQTTGINLIFWDAATGGNQLPQSTLLTDGLTVWISQGVGSCAVRAQVTIQVDDVVDAPVVDSPLQFCTADNSTLADVASQTTGINLIFWDAATGGNQLPQSTLLTDGLTIWISQGVGSCAVRTQVDIQVDDVVDAPIVDSPLQFCTADNSTLADVVSQTSGINLIFWDAATGGNQLPQSTLLTDGLTIWISQGTGSCAVRAQVDIQVEDVVDAPVVDSPLQFCTADNSTLADVASQTTGINLIFWDAATGGNQLPQSTLLTNGLSVWISQGIGNCAARAQVDIQVDDVVDAPVVDSPLQFCTADNSTLADVASQTTGINLIFWDAATGGNQVPQTTLLTDGLSVWISQGTGSCAVRAQVDIQVDDVVDAPVVDSALQFCIADNSTLADVASQTTGINLIFWDAATGGNQLPQSTLLTNGLTVWISQGTDSCAVRAQVDIQVDAIVDAPVVDSALQFCIADNSTLADVASQTTGINLIFWDAATGGNQLPQSTLLTDGLTVWISQGTGSCAVRAQVDIQVANVLEAPVVSALYQFCDDEESTIGDIADQIVGVNLIFWDAAVDGNQLNYDIVLTDGLIMWVSEGDYCNERAEINVEVGNVIAAPIVDSPLKFCTSDMSTIADVASQVIGLNLVFWDSEVGGNQLSLTTLLFNDMTFWVSQGDSYCALREEIKIEIDDVIAAPLVDEPLQFCTMDNATIADVAIQVIGDNLIFWDAANGGNQLPQATILIDNMIFWVSQGIGSCASREEIKTFIDDDVEAPLAQSPLQFCADADSTIEDVAIQVEGNNLIFWDTASGGNQLFQTTLLFDDMTIWVSQGIGICAERSQIDIRVEDVIADPIVNSPLLFCASDNSTIADVASLVTGVNLIFWDAPVDGNQLPESTLLTQDISIWVSQGIDFCVNRVEIVLIEDCDYVEVSKTANVENVSAVGEEIIYTIEITNNGIVGLTDIMVEDPLIDLTYITGDNGNNILDPGETWVYEGSYIVTEADFENNGIDENGMADDDGDIDNIVNFTGTSPSGNDITGSDTEEVLLGQIPTFTFTKTGPAYFCNEDTEVQYTLTITNTSNNPLLNVTFTDDNADSIVPSAVSSINPGQSFDVIATHIITLEDRINGLILNSAVVQAFDINNDVVTAISDDPNNPEDVDVDGDGSPDDITVVLEDTDCDGVPNEIDIDDDNDGIIDVAEAGDIMDVDGDNFVNQWDIDADNDGIPDNVEAQSTFDYIPPLNEDIDGNGLDDAYESSPGAGEGILAQDTDQDGTPDYLDEDTDNDNVRDNIEGNDDDHDGIADEFLSGSDQDFDGLDDGFEGSELNDQDINDEIDLPIIDLPDNDADAGIGDGDMDYRDVNDDNDDELTIDEDANEDGFYFNDDCDNDGIPNYLDPDDCTLELPNAFTPNGEGENETFYIQDLMNLHPYFVLSIFNTDGILVYEYKHDGSIQEPIWWDGFSNGRMTLSGGRKAPAGTYFYVLNPNQQGVKKKVGWLYLTY